MIPEPLYTRLASVIQKKTEGKPLRNARDIRYN